MFRRLLFILLTFLVNFTIFYSYKNIFSVTFYYLKFYYYEKDIFDLVLAFLFILTPAFFIEMELKKPSDLLVLFLYFFSYGPAVIIGLVSSAESFFHSLAYFIVLLVCIMSLILFKKLYVLFPTLKIKGLDPKTFVALLLSLDSLSLIYLSTQFSFGDFSDLARLNVYETRFQVKSQLPDTISLYLFGLVAYVLGPFLIAIGLFYRRYSLFIIGSFSNLIIFAYLGSKTAIFLIPFLVMFYFLIKSKSYHLVYLIFSILFVLIISIWIDSMSSLQLSSYLNRRVFSVPGLLTRVYYDIFSSEPVYNWSYSFLRSFKESMHDLSPPYFVGKYHFGNVNMSANANVWADGFANSIPFGPFLITFFMLLLFWFVDNVSEKKSATCYSCLCRYNISLHQFFFFYFSYDSWFFVESYFIYSFSV